VRRIGLALAALLVLAGCGGSGDDTSTPTTKPPDVRAAVQRAQLVVEDLGGDWKLTGTEPPGTSDTGDQALERCVGKKLDVVEQTEDESETRTFERGADTRQQQVVSSSAAFDSTDRVRRLFDVVGAKRFADCMASAFEDRVKAEAGTEGGLLLDAGTPSVVRPAVAGADRSVHITSPVKVQIDALALDGRFDIVLLSTGRVVSMLLGFSIGEPIPAPQLVHLTQLLLGRQKA
jgi:hypothetical protein